MACVGYQQMRKFSRKIFKAWLNRVTETARGVPPYNHIVQIGDPVLRSPSVPVPHSLFGTPELRCLVGQLKYVLDNYGCVGLSAPQIGIDFRVFVMQFDQKHANLFSATQQEARQTSLVPFTAFVNPMMKVTDYTKVTFQEGCESVKGFVADVPRCISVELTGFDEEGKMLNKNFVGWPARIVQHEMDHLDGTLYTDIMDRNTLACGFWEHVNKNNGRIELPFRP